LPSWLAELEAEGEKSVRLLEGSRAKRLKALKEGSRWVLVNRECPAPGRPDRARPKRGLPEILEEEWEAVILDESASMIRDPQTQITRFFLGDRWKQVTHRWALAGRPDPQSRLLDYWTQMAWCLGSFMGCGNFWKFRMKYFRPSFYEWFPRPGAREKILEAISSEAYVLRRSDVGLDVPKVIEPRFVDMTASWKKFYRKAEDEFCLELPHGDVWTQYESVKFSWLRQIAGGAIQGEVWDGKIRELKELLEGELADEQVVVCFAHREELRRAMLRLSRVNCREIHGDLPGSTRRAYLDQFKRGHARVLLTMTACVETGADLGAADTIVYYSLPLGVLSWLQSQDRILGNLEKPGALVIPLLTRGSVDEDVYRALRKGDLRGRRFLQEVRENFERRRLETGATDTDRKPGRADGGGGRLRDNQPA
jgi:hypothetical protein